MEIKNLKTNPLNQNNYNINIRCYISLNNDYNNNELSFTFYFLNNVNG